LLSLTRESSLPLFLSFSSSTRPLSRRSPACYSALHTSSKVLLRKSFEIRVFTQSIEQCDSRCPCRNGKLERRSGSEHRQVD
jgi:hypothetical protein